MAQNLTEVFHRIHANKKQQRQIRAMYKDELDNDPEYRKVLEDLEALKAKKKQIETSARDSLGKDWETMDLLKLNAKQDAELLSDLALNKLIAGESVELTDPNEQAYEPVVKVSFKKSNIIKKEVI